MYEKEQLYLKSNFIFVLFTNGKNMVLNLFPLYLHTPLVNLGVHFKVSLNN